MTRPTVYKLPLLAASSAGHPLRLPDAGPRLEVLCLLEPWNDTLERCTYLCLEGELLIDLPYGDFIHLKKNDLGVLEAGMARTLTPVGRVTVLMSRG